jgi:hypothetical protein
MPIGQVWAREERAEMNAEFFRPLFFFFFSISFWTGNGGSAESQTIFRAKARKKKRFRLLHPKVERRSSHPAAVWVAGIDLFHRTTSASASGWC